MREAQLVGLARALGAPDVPTLTLAERTLLAGAERTDRRTAERFRDEIAAGGDPLGDTFCALRSPAERRPHGATYTPAPIVDAMIAWARRTGRPARVVDPGAGSGRFIVAAARAFADARLVAVEIDPLAALLSRAHLAAVGAGARATVAVADYRELALSTAEGPTLFVGNPPYVRHHQIEPRWKRWLSHTARRRGLAASQLAGLHLHFFLATAEHAAAGDFGAFVTAAEWLDVNYGSLLRRLFLQDLGGVGLHLIEPAARPFPDALATAAIACFRVGHRPRAVTLRRVPSLADLGALDRGRGVPVTRLAAAPRWTPLTRRAPATARGFVELGELCRVRRGQVTGANRFWIAGPHAADLPADLLVPAITRAVELFRAGPALADAACLRRVIDLPANLDALPAAERLAVERFLRRAVAADVDKGYIARHRRAWWSVDLYPPAPILATYMARRPPAFVRNLVEARHINIAHGIYPRQPMTPAELDALARHLASTVTLGQGRTYAGGLTKFEPGEMERLPVPAP